MRNVVIYYKDSMDNYREEFRAGPYPGNKATEMQRMLNIMGCTDFRVEPYKEKAA